MNTQMWKQNFIDVCSSEHVEGEHVGVARSVKLLRELKLIGFQIEICVSVQPQKNGSRFHLGFILHSPSIHQSASLGVLTVWHCFISLKS